MSREKILTSLKLGIPAVMVGGVGIGGQKLAESYGYTEEESLIFGASAAMVVAVIQNAVLPCMTHQCNRLAWWVGMAAAKLPLGAVYYGVEKGIEAGIEYFFPDADPQAKEWGSKGTAAAVTGVLDMGANYVAYFNSRSKGGYEEIQTTTNGSVTPPSQ